MICSTMWVKSGVKVNVSRKIYDRLTVAEPDTSVRVEVWLSNGHFGQIEIAACRYIEEVTSRQSRRIRLNPKWPQAQLQLQKTTRGDAAELNKGKAEEDMMTTQKIQLPFPLLVFLRLRPPLKQHTLLCWSNGTKSGVSVRFGPLQTLLRREFSQRGVKDRVWCMLLFTEV
ncbi:hypothetical protein F7725_019541, partial [Dissostichus mawsoni]